MQANIKDFQSDKVLTRTLFNNFGSVLVFVFYAQWNEKSTLFLQSLTDSIEVFGQYDNVKYFSISAQKCPETLKKFQVQYTPTVIFTQTDKKILKKFEGSENVQLDVSSIFEQLQTVSQQHKTQFQKDKQIWHPKIKNILKSCPLIIFIKGTPENPKCGFTRQLLDIMKEQKLDYTYYDIIEDEYMRYWLRNYSGWDTYPQIYLQGKLVGGLDKLKQSISSGDFQKNLPDCCKQFNGQQKYKDLIKNHKVIIFTDGFAFENKQTTEFIDQKIKQNNYEQDQVYLLNINIDEKIKNYFQNSGIKLPHLVDSGVPKI